MSTRGPIGCWDTVVAGLLALLAIASFAEAMVLATANEPTGALVSLGVALITGVGAWTVAR